MWFSTASAYARTPRLRHAWTALRKAARDPMRPPSRYDTGWYMKYHGFSPSLWNGSPLMTCSCDGKNLAPMYPASARKAEREGKEGREGGRGREGG